MSRYYIAADGGGSKLQMILYDDDLRIIRHSRVAGVNTLFKPADLVKANVEGMIKDLLQGLAITEIEAADLCLVGAQDIVKEALSRFAKVREIYHHGEPIVALAAAMKTSGAVALSGTGSDAFVVRDGKSLVSIGGWGPLLGDEGSGYDIGLKTIKAAIYAHDSRGPKSALYNLVMEKWNLSNLWELVTYLAGNPDARHEIASAATLCAKAAAAGDQVALDIYENAAMDLFLQARTAIELRREDWNGSVVIVGGAWKGCAHMFEVFKHQIEQAFPTATVEKPLLEPVAGCVVIRCLREGIPLTEIQKRMTQSFKDYLYSEA